MKRLINPGLLLIICCVLVFGCAPVKPAVNPAPVTPQVSAPDNTGIEQQVKKLQPQIHILFQKYAKENKMQGTLSITLYIDEAGNLATSDVKMLNGDLSKEFMKATEDLVQAWKFNTNQKVIYEFEIGFRK